MSTKKKAGSGLADLAKRDRPQRAKAPVPAPEPVVEPGEADAPEGEPVEVETPAGGGASLSTRAKASSKSVARASVVEVGTWVHEVTIAQARAAYAADLISRGADAPTSFDEWTGDAIRALAAMSPEARERKIEALPEEPQLVPDETAQVPGVMRKYKRKGGKVRLAEDVAARMDEARLIDHERGELRGKNTFLVAAIRVATERARVAYEKRTGEAELPPAPKGRLPRQSTKRR